MVTSQVVNSIVFYVDVMMSVMMVCFFFFQAEDGIRDLVRSRGLGDVYKRQALVCSSAVPAMHCHPPSGARPRSTWSTVTKWCTTCLLYTSDAADERSSVDLGGRRILKKKKQAYQRHTSISQNTKKHRKTDDYY